jgi:hypothetical protein
MRNKVVVLRRAYWADPGGFTAEASQHRIAKDESAVLVAPMRTVLGPPAEADTHDSEPFWARPIRCRVVAFDNHTILVGVDWDGRAATYPAEDLVRAAVMILSRTAVLGDTITARAHSNVSIISCNELGILIVLWLWFIVEIVQVVIIMAPV